MSKLSFFFTTLIAAIPAAFLGYLCVMAFLLYSENLPPIVMGVAGITLLACVAVVAMPAAVLIKGGKTKEPKPADKVTDEERLSEEELLTDEDEAAVHEAAATTDTDENADVFVEGEADEFEDFDEPTKK